MYDGGFDGGCDGSLAGGSHGGSDRGSDGGDNNLSVATVCVYDPWVRPICAKPMHVHNRRSRHVLRPLTSMRKQSPVAELVYLMFIGDQFFSIQNPYDNRGLKKPRLAKKTMFDARRQVNETTPVAGHHTLMPRAFAVRNWQASKLKRSRTLKLISCAGRNQLLMRTG